MDIFSHVKLENQNLGEKFTKHFLKKYYQKKLARDLFGFNRFYPLIQLWFPLESKLCNFLSGMSIPILS